MATSTPDSLEQFKKIVKSMKIAMLTTVDDDGHLRSRPMATQQTEFDGETLWYFTALNGGVIRELENSRQVNASFGLVEDNTYVSISGVGALVLDKSKMQELWSPIHKAWFPKGLEDPNLALLKLTVEKAEYWDAPSSAVVQIAGFLKAVATGTPLTKAGDHKKLNFNPGLHSQI